MLCADERKAFDNRRRLAALGGGPQQRAWTMQLGPRLVAVDRRKASLVAQSANLNYSFNVSAVGDCQSAQSASCCVALNFWISARLLTIAQPATRGPGRANAAAAHAPGATGTRPQVACTDPSHTIPATLALDPRVGRYSTLVQASSRERDWEDAITKGTR